MATWELGSASSGETRAGKGDLVGMCYRRRGGVLSPEHCWWAGDAWRAGGASVPDQDALPVRAAARGAVRCQTLSGVPTQQPGMKHPGTSTRTGTHSRDKSTHINTEQNPITLYNYEVALIRIFILDLYIHSQWPLYHLNLVSA